MPSRPRFEPPPSPSSRRQARRGPAVVVLAAATLFMLVSAGCAVSRIKVAADLAKASQPFEAAPSSPARRLLIVGDSTAVGTGASSPRTSVAGLIASDHPDWAIDNRARDGAKFAEIESQLDAGQRYDVVLVMAGGNDVIRLTGAGTLDRQVRAVAERARTIAPRVILMPSGNVGNAPFFFPPWSWWMSQRSRNLHAIVRHTAASTGAVYVNLYQERENDPFVQQPDVMNAKDGLHPSDAGYRVWYRALQEQAAL